MRHLEEDPDCQHDCAVTDKPCNCLRLRDCASRMKPYDFAVLFAGGFIDNSNGNFTIPAGEELMLFDVDGGLTAKINEITDLVASDTDEDCTKLLEQFHSACPPETSCTSANEKSYQLTVDQICDAVGSNTLLLIEEIGKAYEDHTLIQGGPFLPEGEVDNEVLEWYESQASGEGSCGSIDGEVIGTNCRLDWLNGQRGDDEVHNECKTSCRNIMDAKLQEVESEWIDDLQSGTCLQDNSKFCNADTDCLVRKCVGYESTICSSSSDCPIVTLATLSTCQGYVNRFCTSDSQCPGVCIGTNCSPGRCIAGTPAVRAECGAEQFPSPCEFTGERCVSISSEVCGEFVSGLDRMFQASPNGPQENPMRINPDEPIYPAIGLEAMSRAQFPIEAKFRTNEHGITQQVGYENADLYDYAEQLPFPGLVRSRRGAWTLRQEENWLRCVWYTNDGNRCTNPDKVPSLASNNEVHPIVCCSDTMNTNPWFKASANSPSWCPWRLNVVSGLIPEADRCKYGTFDEAVTYCAKYGGRLCSSEEFENNCAGNSGCAWSQRDDRGEVAWSAYTYEYSANTGCISSLNDPVLYGKALQACDDSMAILVGSATSVGMVSRYSEIVNDPNSTVENPYERLPGTCCMDNALDSDHFGFDVSVLRYLILYSSSFIRHYSYLSFFIV